MGVYSGSEKTLLVYTCTSATQIIAKQQTTEYLKHTANSIIYMAEKLSTQLCIVFCTYMFIYQSTGSSKALQMQQLIRGVLGYTLDLAFHSTA